MAVMPKWAQDLVINALLEFKPEAPIPEIKWQRSSHYNSSGKCYSTAITINAGINRKDAKLILLHELAHWILPRIKKFYGRGKWRKEHEVPQGHTPEFWDLVWSLFKWAKLPVSYCKTREYEYRKGAKEGYLRSKKLGKVKEA